MKRTTATDWILLRDAGQRESKGGFHDAMEADNRIKFDLELREASFVLCSIKV